MRKSFAVGVIFVLASCNQPTSVDHASAEVVSAGDIEKDAQGWTSEERKAWYNGTFGGGLLPSSWMRSLESPVPAEGGVSLLAAVIGSGFVANPDTPFGVAGLIEVQTPNGPAFSANCALCHTGQINYKGKQIIVDGSAMTADISTFLQLTFGAVIATSMDPARFERFASAVLGEAASSPEARAQLRGGIDAMSAAFQQQGAAQAALGLEPIKAGPGRLDAVAGIGNSVFGPLNPAKNFYPAAAPVSTPAIWETAQMDWLHYGGGSNEAIHRNMSQGVSWELGFTLAKPDTYASSVNLFGTYALQDLSNKLKAPRWPEAIFGSIDAQSARRGQAIYAQTCASCHTATFADNVMHVNQIDIDVVGTDREYFNGFNNRRYDLTAIGLGNDVPASEAYTVVLQGLLDKAYEINGVDEATRATLEKDSVKDTWRATEVFKANPLTGVWATAPYLHNGSVASLRDLLNAAADRQATFFVGGSRDYDPKNVGFVTASAPDGFQFDTSLPGNRNTGHEYGVTLSDSDKTDLVEYLKSL